MFSFLGSQVLGRDRAVYSGSIIDVFGRVGVSEEAVRSTLGRMVRRDLLARHRRGRKMYFGLTPRAGLILEDGYRRVYETGAVNRDWDGTWTLVGFSLPDTRRSERHSLRSKLMWEGFGMLQNGLWIAAGRRDVATLVESLALGDHVNVFTGRAMKPTESGDVVRKAFDTTAIAERYRAFLDRWDTSEPMPGLSDDLARQLVLHHDWLQLVRQDPHLPVGLLPGDWPAIRAEGVFQSLASAYRGPARALAEEILDEIQLPTTA